MKFKGVNKEGVVVIGTGYVPYGNNEVCIVNNIDDLKNRQNVVPIDTLSVSIGINDNNNTEVYNNDIIKVQLNDLYDYYYLITYNAIKARFECIGSNSLEVMIEAGIPFEVVGNKFTSQELLNRCLKHNG